MHHLEATATPGPGFNRGTFEGGFPLGLVGGGGGPRRETTSPVLGGAGRKKKIKRGGERPMGPPLGWEGGARAGDVRVVELPSQRQTNTRPTPAGAVSRRRGGGGKRFKTFFSAGCFRLSKKLGRRNKKKNQTTVVGKEACGMGAKQ